MQYELGHDGLQVFQGSFGQALARAVALGIEVAAAPGLVEAALLVGVEALFIVPQHDGAAHVEGLASCNNGSATGRAGWNRGWLSGRRWQQEREEVKEGCSHGGQRQSEV